MTAPAPKISPEIATAVVRAALDPTLRITAVKPLHGGMVNLVQEWTTDGAPAAVVAKLSTGDPPAIHREFAALRWFRAHTRFPVPAPYACVDQPAGVPGAVLLMQRLPGRHLAAARLTRQGVRHAQAELARHVADLHEQHRDTYGEALGGPTYPRWLDWFGPLFAENLHDAADHLSPEGRRVATRLLDHLADWLPEAGVPTLVHGDLWATNILVDDADPDRPVLSGFVDPHGLYADVEYELAYLRVFHTADADFFTAYARRHPLREGFERRCRVYWLNTLLLHVWLFGEEYVPRCEAIAREVERLG